ncbi:MAG: hypothetical protein QNL04_15435 [SAR324 cluster bacterium]|nr:hypothetical protein [SAR324 cluster bacterium]
MTQLKRFQGTDGIRGKTANADAYNSAAASALKGCNPLDFYLEQSLLTPQFFKGYCFAFANILLEEQIAKKDDLIIIGSDPRDPSGEFLEQATQGIEAAGLKVCNVGILPTPAIPLYMLHSGALGGVMLTASHNPPDQNGIKLFHAHLGLKFLPLDDEKLTAKLFDLDWNSLLKESPEKNRVNHITEAKEFFVALHLDPKNSWGKVADFSNTILAVDASKGAATPVTEEIFHEFNFASVHVFCKTGPVNLDCGVANIEGKEWITAEMVLGENASFKNYQALTSVFSLSENPEVQGGQKELVLLVFDGDADRCFLLYYFPEKNAFRVLSGDSLGLIQARYLTSQNQKGEFIHTVESDFELSKAAIKLGQEVRLTGVGDKWILARACLGLVSEFAKRSNDQRLTDLSQREPANLSGFEASKIMGEFFENLSLANASEIIETNFLLGLEESGHSITPTTLQTPFGKSLAFAGNGIKAGLNGLAALSFETNRKELVEETFEAGYKKTFYIYHVDKAKLLGGSPYLADAAPKFEQMIAMHLGSEIKTQVLAFAEEPDLYFIELNKDGKKLGAVFLRNSGTEDKSALYLRGPKVLGPKLKGLGFELHQELLANLKEPSKELCQLELTILHSISEEPKNVKDLKDIEKNYGNQTLNMALHEMEHKQDLIFNQAGLFKITPKGLYLLNQL